MAILGLLIYFWDCTFLGAIVYPLPGYYLSDWKDIVELQMIIDAIEQVGGIYVITADHGNAEDMVKRNKAGDPLLDKNGKIQILTSHTLQPVSWPNYLLKS